MHLKSRAVFFVLAAFCLFSVLAAVIELGEGEWRTNIDFSLTATK
jgi:hypothetical protein